LTSARKAGKPIEAVLHDEETEDRLEGLPEADRQRLEHLSALRQLLEERRDRLQEIEAQMYDAEVDENRGLMVRLLDEREELERKIDPLEAEIYELEFRRPPRRAH
jgi:hypothetical protein